MSDPGELNEESAAEAAAIGHAARERRLTVACAESLTGGSIASRLSAAEAASEWFAGGVTAYSSEVKFNVLGVERGPVVTAECASQMAEGVARLMDADVAVAVTGEGGPNPAEDKPVGTVFIAVRCGDAGRVEEHHFEGDPAQIVQRATLHALRILHAAVRRD